MLASRISGIQGRGHLGDVENVIVGHLETPDIFFRNFFEIAQSSQPPPGTNQKQFDGTACSRETNNSCCVKQLINVPNPFIITVVLALDACFAA